VCVLNRAQQQYSADSTSRGIIKQQLWASASQSTAEVVHFTSSSSSMSSPRAEKRSICENKGDLLSNTSILQHVMSYVSPTIFLYIAGVSSLWKQCYEQVTLNTARKEEQLQWRRASTEVPRITTCNVAFETWAFTSGLALEAGNHAVQRAAGAHGSLLTLAVAHGLGLEFDEHTLHGAVESDRESIVNFLLTEHRCPMAWYIGFAAASSGNLRMLKFLRERGFKFSHFAMCCDAAEGGHLETLKYLRQEGCSWFGSTIAGSAARSGNLEMVSMSKLSETHRPYALKSTHHHLHMLACSRLSAPCTRQ
jgi:hypothetical protein